MYLSRLLGINAVVDSPQQIVHFPRADFGLCIIQRHYAAETVLRKLKPGSSSFEVAKNAGRVLEQPGKTDELVRFIRRQASRSLRRCSVALEMESFEASCSSGRSRFFRSASSSAKGNPFSIRRIR